MILACSTCPTTPRPMKSIYTCCCLFSGLSYTSIPIPTSGEYLKRFLPNYTNTFFCQSSMVEKLMLRLFFVYSCVNTPIKTIMHFLSFRREFFVFEICRRTENCEGLKTFEWPKHTNRNLNILQYRNFHNLTDNLFFLVLSRNYITLARYCCFKFIPDLQKNLTFIVEKIKTKLKY